MAIRTTVDLPEALYDMLRQRAARSGTSVRALIIRAIEQVYSGHKKRDYLTRPLITGTGKLGPDFPRDENPHDLAFS